MGNRYVDRVEFDVELDALRRKVAELQKKVSKLEEEVALANETIDGLLELGVEAFVERMLEKLLARATRGKVDVGLGDGILVIKIDTKGG